MSRWETIGREITSLAALALSWPLERFLLPDGYDPQAPHPTPVVLVHGFMGAPSNLLVVRNHLARHGIRNTATFRFGPRLDWDRLADELVQAVDQLRRSTGARLVDVVGHSLGGLIARRLIERGGAPRIRRLVSLGAPYFARPTPPNELPVYGGRDPFVPVPRPASRPRDAVLLPDCGHWGLLFHPHALDAITAFLRRPSTEGLRRPATVVPLRAGA